VLSSMHVLLQACENRQADRDAHGYSHERPSLRTRTMTIMTSNRQLVLDAFDTLFNRRDYSAAERLWSPSYQQHSAHIPPGRDGLFDLIRAAPAALRYEAGRVLAEDDVVMVHGHYSNTGLPADWIVVDIVRVANGQLVEHWDVIQDEATRATSKSGLPMFGMHFPGER